MRLLLPALLAAGSAVAQERPAVLPTHDVTVEYSIESSAALPVRQFRIAAQADAARLRVEQPNSLVLLLDRTRQRFVMLLGAQGAVLTLPWPRQVQQGYDMLRRARLVRRGQGVQAGLACTNYDVDADATRLTACLTSDGVALRVDGAMRGQTYHLAATSVSYTPLDAALFAAPPGSRRLQLPNLVR